MKTISVLGATGSVGCQALDVARSRGYKVDFMSANRDVCGMERAAREFKPELVAMADENAARDLQARLSDTSVKVLSGEGGVLGSEEIQIITPAIQAAAEERIYAFGPFAADGLFLSGAFAKYDALLAMYHDQGLIPFKALTPDGVNYTAGLSVVRTSPDHGTAYDIAGKGVADAQATRNALYAAVDIIRNRERREEMTANPLPHYEREKGRDISISELKLPEQHD